MIDCYFFAWNVHDFTWRVKITVDVILVFKNIFVDVFAGRYEFMTDSRHRARHR